MLLEDPFGARTATVRAVRADRTARVYEVTGPDAWLALASDHPLEVTASRRHDWYRSTGWDGRWVVPDWPSVARDWDAVHVPVTGYLATAGRALPVDDGPGARTVLTGWDPGTTWWLADVVELGPPVVWLAGEDRPLAWSPSGAG